MLTLTFPGVFLRNVGTHSDILLPTLRSQSYKLCMFLFLNLAASAKKKKKKKLLCTCKSGHCTANCSHTNEKACTFYRIHNH